MRNSSKAMEQHGRELNDQNQRKEEHENETNRFKLQIFFCDVNLKSFRTRKVVLILAFQNIFQHLTRVKLKCVEHKHPH